MYADVMTVYLKALGDLVAYPDPQLGWPDEGSRAVNRCMAATADISGLPAMEAARILGHAAATIEEEPEGGDGLSMIIGEALRLSGRRRFPGFPGTGCPETGERESGAGA